MEQLSRCAGAAAGSRKLSKLLRMSKEVWVIEHQLPCSGHALSSTPHQEQLIIMKQWGQLISKGNEYDSMDLSRRFRMLCTLTTFGRAIHPPAHPATTCPKLCACTSCF